ncbi:MAG: hypothetical protein GY757_11980 [bacterium]|nr:hypothetical protein [bacterium]
MPDNGIQLNSAVWAKPGNKKLALLKGIYTTAKNGLAANWLSVPGNIADTIAAIKLEGDAGSTGWKLVGRALTDALLTLIVEKHPVFQKESIVVDRLDRDLNAILEDSAYFIDADFFKHPERLPFITQTLPLFREFLQLCGFEEVDAVNMVGRLPGYFVFSLVHEWRQNYTYYKALKEHLLTPFDEAADRENQWYLYAKWLTRQMDEPVFDESFSLRQVYIPLRAYYKVSKGDANKNVCEPGHAGRVQEDKVQRIVTLLERELSLWFDSGDKKDAIRLLRGGPGYGKSSFLKKFAEKMAGQRARVIFIPLHRFEVKDDLTEAVLRFLSYDKMITSDPFEEAIEIEYAIDLDLEIIKKFKALKAKEIERT